jgi:hypothetical protein
MKILRSALSLLTAAFVSLAAAQAPQPVGDLAASGQAVLDVVEGRIALGMVSVPYGQALAAAQRQAAAAGKRFAPPPSLRFHEISKSAEGVVLAVTVGTPSEDVKDAIAFLRSREARPGNVTAVRNR